MRVLMVCLGNICRSPAAESVLRRMLDDAGLGGEVEVGSAGNGTWHLGSPADPRSVAASRRAGYELSGVSEPADPEVLAAQDLVVAMDATNVAELERRLATLVEPPPLRRLREFDPEAVGVGTLDVADPYAGGDEGFTVMVADIERACRGLVAAIRDGSAVAPRA